MPEKYNYHNWRFVYIGRVFYISTLVSTNSCRSIHCVYYLDFHDRYINCLMPGCPSLVQARSLDLHLRRDCLERKRICILAHKGKTLDMETACTACGEMLPRKYLRRHIVDDCEMRMVPCSNSGCTEWVQAKFLVDHKMIHCKRARFTAALNAQVAKKPTEEDCPMCHEMVVAGTFRVHTTGECLMRIVACPNRNIGCAEKIQAGELTTHLREQCVVQIDRAERASKHASRHQRTPCSGCGYMVILQHLLHHQRNKCPNRRVPCKHWELGCPAILHLATMNEHLKVDRLLGSRSCLVFDCGKAYIALNEDDKKPPWTVEIWVWRPGLVEGTREKARMALKALWEFQRERGKLAVTERRLTMLEPLLVTTATRAAKEPSQEAEQAMERLTDEMITAATVRDDAKVALVLSVTALSNSLGSATRGIKEITAQNQLRSFTRLALGSTPWYATSPSPDKTSSSSVQGISLDKVYDLKQTTAFENIPLQAEVELKSEIPTVLEPIGMVDEASCLPSTNTAEVEQEEELVSQVSVDCQSWSEEITVDNVNSEGVMTFESGSAGNVKKIDIKEMLNNFAKQQDVLAEAEERELRQKESVFWGEWVALSGQSLAGRILNLADETLPRLKEELVAITDLTAEALFRTAGEPGTENDGAGVDKGSKIKTGKTKYSAKKSGKGRKAVKKAKRKKKHEEKFGKKVESRIAEEVGKRGGLETLLGSDKIRFQMEMGSSDRVGIKIAGKKDQIFNYSCPRERWVHLAFVSDSTGVFLLENGNTASRLQNITVTLPMREIGGRDMACQCLVQEVRYWKVKRSKEELKAWMHEFLPGNMVANGLIGYWTFEEGDGEYVNDVTEQRFRSRKVGRGLHWGSAELMSTVEVGAPPTPSWREHNVCKVRIK